MEKLLEIKEALMRELDKSDTARTGELKGGELGTLHQITDVIKNIDKICMLEEGGYSHDGEWAADMRGAYGRGSSYAGHRMDGMRDDGYSSRRRDSRGRYSRDDGRSEMMEHLEKALDSANEQDREDIRRFMQKLRNT